VLALVLVLVLVLMLVLVPSLSAAIACCSAKKEVMEALTKRMQRGTRTARSKFGRTPSMMAAANTDATSCINSVSVLESDDMTAILLSSSSDDEHAALATMDRRTDMLRGAAILPCRGCHESVLVP
jgi:hypothetical protein